MSVLFEENSTNVLIDFDECKSYNDITNQFQIQAKYCTKNQNAIENRFWATILNEKHLLR